MPVTASRDHANGKFAGVSDPILRRKMLDVVANYAGTQDRFMWQRGLGSGLDPDPRRSIEDECGWPVAPGPEIYDRLYNWDTIGARITSLPPMQTWRSDPEVYETEGTSDTPFELSFDSMVSMLRGEDNWFSPDPQQGGNLFFEVLRRADILSRRCRYGGVWLGFDDDEDPASPVAGFEETGSLPVTFEEGKKAPTKLYTGNGRPVKYNLTVNEERTRGRRLLFMKPFPETQARITRWEANRLSPRYCQPLEYMVTTIDPSVGYWGAGMPTSTQQVHWSRFVHFADTYHHATSSDVLATPSMQVPLYDVLDARKVSGAGSEAFWRNAFLRLFFETIPQLGADAIVNDDELRDMMEQMENGSQRHGRLTGLHANAVAPNVVDPNPHLDAKYKRIAINMAKPKRIFEGSERGEMSSAQDETQDATEVAGRQNRYASACIIAPTVNRLIKVGVLEKPGKDGYKIKWPPVHIADDTEQATVFSTRMQGAAAALAGNVTSLIPERNILVDEMGYSDDEADQMLAEADKKRAEEEQQTADAAAKGLTPDGQPLPAPKAPPPFAPKAPAPAPPKVAT